MSVIRGGAHEEKFHMKLLRIGLRVSSFSFHWKRFELDFKKRRCLQNEIYKTKLADTNDPTVHLAGCAGIRSVTGLQLVCVVPFHRLLVGYQCMGF